MNNLFKNHRFARTLIFTKAQINKEISSWKAVTIIAILAVLAAGLVIASTTGFNIMSGDQELLRMKNQTQGTVDWQDPISANAGDEIKFLVYYHCGTDDPAWSTIRAYNSIAKIEFPTSQQTVITTTGRISANNLTTVSNTGTINVSSPQKLNFSGTAVWYHDGESYNITATVGNGYIEVNLGNIKCDRMDCYDNAGFVVFTAMVSSIFPLPTVDLKANNSNGPITIPYNTAATLSWTSTNATSCSASGNWSGAKALSGSQSTGNLTSNKTYTITCTGSGGTATDSVIVNVQAASPPTVDLKANNSNGPITIPYNTVATLSWTSTNATSCYATADWSGSKALSGSQSTGNLTSNKTYTITCTGSGGSATDSVSVNVQAASPPTVDLKINGFDGTITVPYNTSATLSWTSTNATSCYATADWSGSKALSGSEINGVLTSNKTYTITCTGSGGTATDSVGANVQANQPTVDLKANGSDGQITINYNTAATLSWTSTNATSCSASGNWSGAKALSGSQSTGNLTSNKTYTITCTGSGGTATDSVSVNIQAALPPTVDLKINGFDGTITVPYNTSATLSWTSTNASSCYATDTAWQGYKSLSGSESTGNLLSSKTYIIACSGLGGTASDSVTVNVVDQQQTLYASLEAIPNTGNAPLNEVDLRATATGTATGPITYRFDCASDGIWDQTFNSIYDNPKTVIDACNYQNVGTYIAKVRIERGTASAAEATTTVIVGSAGTQDLSVTKLGRNLSDNTAYGEVTISDPGEVIEFRIFITNTGNTTLNDVMVKDTLPVNMSYYGGLKVDEVPFVGANISTGFSVGSLSPQQTKTIIYQAVIAGSANFAFGTTTLTNTALVYNTSVSRTDHASVNVIKTQVLGVTDVPTGVLDSAKIAFIFSIMATILLTYFLLLKFYVRTKAYAFGIDDIVFSAKKKITNLLPKEPLEKSEEKLAKIIEEIRKKEKNI